jgi:hypothetical protein
MSDTDKPSLLVPLRPTDMDVARALGRIESKLESIQMGQSSQSDRLAKMDERLRAVEKSSAVHGAVGGVMAATGVTLIVEFLKRSVGG